MGLYWLWLTDTDNLDSDIKEGCAKYANADRLGLLNPTLTVDDDKGSLIEETGKVGDLEKTQKWSKTTKRNRLLGIDKLSSLYCRKKGNTLVRV
jgi:hypothetical protein